MSEESKDDNISKFKKGQSESNHRNTHLFRSMKVSQNYLNLVQGKLAQRRRIFINIIFKYAICSIFYNNKPIKSPYILLFYGISFMSEIIHFVFYCLPNLSFDFNCFLSFLFFNELLNTLSTFILSYFLVLKYLLHMNISFRVIMINFIIIALNSYSHHLNSAIVIESNTRTVPFLLIREQWTNVILFMDYYRKLNSNLFEVYLFISSLMLNYALVAYYDNDDYFCYQSNRISPFWAALFFLCRFYILLRMIMMKEVVNRSCNEITYVFLFHLIIRFLINSFLLFVDTPIYTELNKHRWKKQRRIRKIFCYALMNISNSLVIFVILIYSTKHHAHSKETHEYKRSC